MSIFDQFSKVTKDFGNKAQEMTKDIKGKLEEQQAISRLNAQVNEAKNQMKNTYMAIGERYYELHKDDVENDMANQFQIIADAMEKIAKCEKQIRDIKNENTSISQRKIYIVQQSVAITIRMGSHITIDHGDCIILTHRIIIDVVT